MTLRISGLLAPAAFAAACCKRPNARSALPQGRKRAEVGSGRWQWRATAASAVTFAFGLFQPAHAQVTYYYTGNPFVASAAPDVSPQGCSFYIPDPCINGHVTGTVIYNSPGPGDFSFTLTANGVTLESNNYNAPSCYVATSGVCELGAEFFVQNGIPTAWDLELVSSETPVSNFAYITTLDGVGRGVPAGAGSDEALFGQGYLGALNITAVGATDSPGVWTTTPPTCAQILTGAVGSAVLSGQGASTTGEPTTIQVTFAPNYGMTLQQAATACGFDSTVGASGFNWIQQKRTLRLVLFLLSISPVPVKSPVFPPTSLAIVSTRLLMVDIRTNIMTQTHGMLILTISEIFHIHFFAMTSTASFRGITVPRLRIHSHLAIPRWTIASRMPTAPQVCHGPPTIMDLAQSVQMVS